MSTLWSIKIIILDSPLTEVNILCRKHTYSDLEHNIFAKRQDD